jgi:hypothetical protein
MTFMAGLFAADLLALAAPVSGAAKEDGISAQVVAAIIAGAVSLAVLAITAWLNSQRDRDNRRRDTYSKAFAAVAAYKEFPYVVRRRRSGSAAVAADERVRISEELRSVQHDLSYYSAWTATESASVATAYRHLAAETRRIAGTQIHEAWLAPPARNDGNMNMPDLGLGELVPVEAAFLAVVADDLSLWPHRRWRRKADRRVAG